MIKTVKQIISDYRERRFRMWCLRMYLRACGRHHGAKMPLIYQYVKEGKSRKERRYRKKCIEIAAGISYGPMVKSDYCGSTLMEYVDFMHDFFRQHCEPRDFLSC